MPRKNFLLLVSVGFLAFGVFSFIALLGRPRDLPPAHIPLNDLELPVARTYPAQPKRWPVEKISVWLKHEGLVADANSRFLRWEDSGPHKLRLNSSSKTASPDYVKAAIGSFSALRFRKEVFIESGLISGERLFKSDSFAIYVLFKPLGDLADSKISDLFGWGDCGERRMLSHIQGNDRLEFQYGSPTYRTQSMAIANPINQYNLAVFTSNPSTLSIELNGRLISSRKNIGGFSAKWQTSVLRVGNSACENGFDGEIAELMVVSDLTEQQERDAVTQYLIKKHSLEF